MNKAMSSVVQAKDKKTIKKYFHFNFSVEIFLILLIIIKIDNTTQTILVNLTSTTITTTTTTVKSTISPEMSSTKKLAFATTEFNGDNINSEKQNTIINSSLLSSENSKEKIQIKPLAYLPQILTNITLDSTDYVTSNILFESSLPIQGWRCHCWNSTSGIQSEDELECRCEGSALLRIPQLLHQGMQRFTVATAGLKSLRSTGLKVYASSLLDIMLNDLPDFAMVEDGAFNGLQVLRTIYISHSPKLKYLQAEAFRGVSKTLKSLRIIYCGLIKIPDMRLLSSNIILHMVDLEGNQIERIGEKSVKINTEQLIIDNNPLKFVENSAFYGSQIAKISLKGNLRLKLLDKSAFVGIVNIRELDLSSTSLQAVPTEGLTELEVLRIQNTHSLKMIPSVYNFKNLRVAWLTHSFHCCAFKFPSRHDPTKHQERIKHLDSLQKACRSSNTPTGGNNNNNNNNNDFVKINGNIIKRNAPSDKRRQDNENNNTKLLSKRVKRYIHRFLNDQNAGVNYGSFAQNKTYGDNFNEIFLHETYKPITGSPLPRDESLNIETSNTFTHNPVLGEFHGTTADISTNVSVDAICGNLTQHITDTIQCYPIPDALNPCEDVMGSHWLRGSVWIVVLLAVFGNVAVLVVLFSNRSDVTVPKFLMSNLALADLCMGFYLLLIASIDAHSMGEYFNFAFDWQYGSGCKAAGFLTVFASHLSVFTLTIITLERWFAITYAMYLNKRLRLKAAAYIMLCGWIYSMIMAALPLFGVSNYSSTSICLPMEARDSLDVAYLITVLAINGLAFLVIVVCYTQIYFSLGKETRRSARHASTGEMTVAKKMALLVFTNFACWAPIAFFGLTAIAGYPLINVAKSKILLVFFYPLNSCANPYLYAILTSQYRRDLFMLLSKYGFCTQRAQQYKLTYSIPVTNHTYPLIARNSISGAQPKAVRSLNIDEAFV